MTLIDDNLTEIYHLSSHIIVKKKREESSYILQGFNDTSNRNYT